MQHRGSSHIELVTGSFHHGCWPLKKMASMRGFFSKAKSSLTAMSIDVARRHSDGSVRLDSVAWKVTIQGYNFDPESECYDPCHISNDSC